MQEFLKQVPQWVEQGLGIDTGKVLVQFISIAILFFFVYKFLWKPITNLLDERHNVVSNDLDEAKRANEEAHKIKEELTEKLVSAKTEAKNIIEASRERGESERVRIVEDADREAKSILRKAEDEIDREITVARQNLKEEIVEVAYQMAEKIVEKEVDRTTNAKTVKDVLEGKYDA